MPRRLLAALVLAAAVTASCGSPAPSGSGGGAGTGVATASAAESGDAAAAADSGLRPKGETISGLPVTRVVDGDTIHVDADGEDVTVRMIGMNTPETVKPDSPVECFGPESSDFAKQTLTDATVTLEFDESQGRTDQYDRVLAYVWRELPGGGLSMFNLESVAGGYAFQRQYGPNAYAWKDVFQDAQADAQDAGAGLWGACPEYS